MFYVRNNKEKYLKTNNMKSSNNNKNINYSYLTFTRHNQNITLAYCLLVANNNNKDYLIIYTGGGTTGIRACKSLGEALTKKSISNHNNNNNGFNVIVWDRRNTGQSSFCVGNGKIPLPIEDALDLCELVKCCRNQLGYHNKIILMGRSAGARVSCLCVHLLGPEQLHGLILAPPTGGSEFAVNSLIDLYYETPKQAFIRGDFDTVIQSYNMTNHQSIQDLKHCNVDLFCSAMDCSTKWMSQFINQVFVGLHDKEFAQLSTMKNCYVIHSGDVHDDLHTPKASIGVAAMLKIKCVFVIEHLMTRKSNDHVAELIKELFLTSSNTMMGKL
jgi:hypothetical protein